MDGMRFQFGDDDDDYNDDGHDDDNYDDDDDDENNDENDDDENYDDICFEDQFYGGVVVHLWIACSSNLVKSPICHQRLLVLVEVMTMMMMVEMITVMRMVEMLTKLDCIGQWTWSFYSLF